MLKKNLSSQVGLVSLMPKWWGSGRGLAVTGPTTVGFQALKNSSGGKGALKQKKQILAQLGIEEKAGWLLGGRQLNLMGFSSWRLVLSDNFGSPSQPQALGRCTSA